jgi:hypothetical protein
MELRVGFAVEPHNQILLYEMNTTAYVSRDALSSDSAV